MLFIHNDVGTRPQVQRAAALKSVGQTQQSQHNHLLASLSVAESARLRPLMSSITLPRGTVVYGADADREHLYFPTSGIFMRRFETTSGETIGFGVTGSEGAVGIAMLLGGRSAANAVLTLAPAHAYRIGATVLNRELERGGPFADVLLRYVQFTIAALGQDVACNRFHAVEQQLCRWLLACLDRSTSNVLTLTHEKLGNQLGVRRESVTAAVRKLKMAGAFDCHRGRITIHNRALLEAAACECYENIRREHARLFPQSGPSAQRSDAGDPALGATPRL